VVVDVGCGSRKLDGAIGLDLLPTDAADVVGDAMTLPFATDSVDRLYAAHVVEHFSHRRQDDLVAEWTRIVKPGGTVEVRCPWLRFRALFYAVDPSPDNVRNIYGRQDHEGNYHKNGFSLGTLRRLLERNGLRDVELCLPRSGFLGVPYLPSDLHLRGTATG
jgi:predicted SAM-dependent methyltransferase